MRRSATVPAGSSRRRPRLRGGRRLRLLLAGALAGSTLAPGLAVPPAQAAGTGFAGSGISAYGGATDYGGFSGQTVPSPLVAMAAPPGGKGYWVTAADGSVYGFGDASDHGSMAGKPLQAPVVGMASTPDGLGYWLVASDGGVFSFGDARFYGSTGAIKLNQPVVGMASTPDGKGYWLVASDGGIFSFGDARFFGSAANENLGAGVVAMARTPDGGGYWMVAATGGVLTFGDATSYGPDPNKPPFSPTADIVATADGKGYWLLRPDEVETSFGDPGDPGGSALGRSIVAVAESQVGPDPDFTSGPYCNPYGPCEEWCALFATWVWGQRGVAIPRYAFVGDVYDWGSARGLTRSPTTMPSPGDFVLFGTGPENVATSPHMGIVAQVWPDGAVATVEGDAGPEPAGDYAVVVNGPFLPAYSRGYNGFPVYAWVQP